MIGFFRKIRKQLADDNKPLKYMRYAIGEIVLVVIGILIALGINNWNETKKILNKEKILLAELKSNLESNLMRLGHDIKIQNRGAWCIDFLIDHFENKRPFNDSIAKYLQEGNYAPDVILTSSSFETLKSTGLDLIKSDTLRQEIINLFEVTYPYLMQETKRIEDQVWPATVVPIFQIHLRMKEGRWFPNNYESMLKDEEFLNMWSFRLELRKNSTFSKSRAVKETNEVIGMIQDELIKRGK